MFKETETIFENSEYIDAEKKLSIIHFNDIYNIESRKIEPVGGATRFVTAVEYLIEQNPSSLVLFSGDALSPSTSKQDKVFFSFYINYIITS